MIPIQIKNPVRFVPGSLSNCHSAVYAIENPGDGDVHTFSLLVRLTDIRFLMLSILYEKAPLRAGLLYAELIF
jgi:hypothetical protein